MAAKSREGEKIRLIDRLAGIVAAAALGITLIAAGFAACCLPVSTSALANLFSADELSPFTKEQLVSTAVETADYSFLGNNRNALLSQLAAINLEAHTPYATWSVEEIVNAPEQYTLTADALAHLDDCYAVARAVRLPLVIIALLALAALAHVGVRIGKRQLGRALRAAGWAVVVCFAALALWLIFDFNGFFSAFHTLFFDAGTWLFSYDSLLICLYPEGFWMGMASIWVATSVLLSILCVSIGTKLAAGARAR